MGRAKPGRCRDSTRSTIGSAGSWEPGRRSGSGSGAGTWMDSLVVIYIARFRDSDDVGRGSLKSFGRQKDYHRRNYHSCCCSKKKVE